MGARNLKKVALFPHALQLRQKPRLNLQTKHFQPFPSNETFPALSFR
jgi:hypothetical protein